MTWYGFNEYESGVSKYHIGVGRTFTDNELTNGLLEIDGYVHKSEQNELIYLNIGLTSSDKMFVSILAENGVGLISPIVRVTLIVKALLETTSGDVVGPFEIEDHSCDIHFCNKSNRKAMNRNWSNLKANPALKTKQEINKYYK